MLSDEREADELIGMMMRYLATGEMPEGRTDAQRMCLVQVLPVLEKTRTKSVQGARGGRKSRKGDKRTGKRTASETVSERASETVSELASETVTEEEEEERSKTLTGFKENAPAFSAEPQGFTPPALDEVRGYFGANCLRGDPDAFVDHYAALGWKQNGRDVYDWKPLARQWHRRQVGFDADARAQGRQTSADAAEAAVWRPAETDDEALERIEAELAALEGAA